MNIDNYIKPGYKKTPVGIIPEDWEVKKFQDIVVNKGLIRGPFGSALKKEFFVSNGYKVYEQQNAIYKDFERGSYFVDESKFQELKRFAVRKNDFIMSCSGTIGELYQIPKNYLEGIINQALLLIRLNPLKIKYEFFENVFKTPFIKNRILESQGGAIKNLVGMNQIRKLKLPIPPLYEQKSIANCLSTWDSGIEKLTQLIQAKKLRKKGLMQQIFNGQLAIDNEQLPVEIRLKKVDNEEDRLKGWKEVRLEEIGKVEYGTRIVKDRTERGNYFVYGGGGKTFTTKTFNREDNMIIARFAMSSECARFVKGKFFLNDSGLTVKSKKDTYQLFLDYILFHFQYRIYALRAGGAQQNLDVSALKKIKMKVPSYKEQTAIAEILQAADKEIELLEQKLEAFKEQKKGLMQVLLTGEKRLV